MLRNYRLFVTALLPTIAILACSGAREHALLDQFFTASRLRDLTALHSVATVVFEPKEQGTILDFEITAIQRRGDHEDVSVSVRVRTPAGEIVQKALRVTITGGFVTSVVPAPSRP